MKIIANQQDLAPTQGEKVLRLANDVEPADAGDLNALNRIELEFPKFTDGRAYSQAVLLRRRLGFTGDIRATGDVLIDQLVQMARCGFTSAVLAPGLDASLAERQFSHYDAFYQGDALQPRPHFNREPA